MSEGMRYDTVWWQGAPFRIKGRKEQTDGALGLVEADFWAGFATPHHVHHREDESWFILEGRMLFQLGDKEFTATAGDFVFGPREVAHRFKALQGGARALLLMTPAGLEQMFAEGGIPMGDSGQEPLQEFDVELARALTKKYGCDVIGPPLP
jgi:quercetin dioxygenase-like cupin family protein